MSNLPIESNPFVNLIMEAMSTETRAHADFFNERYKQLLNNDAYFKSELVKFSGKTASKVPLTVEKVDLIGMINELFQLASNGKTAIANVTGGVNVNNTHEEIANRIASINNVLNDILQSNDRSTLTRTIDCLSQRRNDLAAQLTTKGIASSGNEGMSTLIQKIGGIKSFIQKKANGVVIRNDKSMEIVPLDFTPDKVSFSAFEQRKGDSTANYENKYTLKVIGVKEGNKIIYRGTCVTERRYTDCSYNRGDWYHYDTDPIVYETTANNNIEIRFNQITRSISWTAESNIFL